MNRNGTPAIILIYLMTTLPVLVDRRSQRLAEATPAYAGVNLYSTFKDRLNATSNFAQSEYDAKTSTVVSKIYDLAGKILKEQLKQQRMYGLQKANYADSFEDEPESPPRSHDMLPPAVAPPAPDAAAIEDAKKNPPQSMNAGSGEKQMDARKARRALRASRRFGPRCRRTKKSYAGRRGSGPEWVSRRMRPSVSEPEPEPAMGGGEKWELPIESKQLHAKPSGASSASVEEQAVSMDDDWRWGSSSSSKEAIDSDGTDAFFDPGMNDWPRSIDDGGNGNGRQRLASNKWRRKLRINSEGEDFENYGLQPSLSEELQSYNGADEEEVEPRSRSGNEGPLGNYGSRINTRSADSFPEVFAPVGDSGGATLPVIASELNDAIKNANNLFTAVPNIGPAIVNSGDAGRRIGKQIQPADQSPPPQQNPNPSVMQPREVPDLSTTANLTNVMEKVLGELENLRESKAADNMQPEGSPCDVVGTWNSEAIGLQFHISLADPIPQTKAYGMEGKRIEIDITERVPPRPHSLLDCDWMMTGITLKQFGGPFYITAQKTERYMVATFAGLCKTCGNIPTIFGAWTFVSPARDCEDISIVVDTRRDVLRKDTMQAKRKHRMERLRGKPKGKCLACSYR